MIDPGYPKPIADAWVGVPDHIDSVFEWNNKVFFFKGNRVCINAFCWCLKYFSFRLFIGDFAHWVAIAMLCYHFSKEFVPRNLKLLWEFVFIGKDLENEADRIKM